MLFVTNTDSAQLLETRLLERNFRVYKAFYHATKSRKAFLDYLTEALPNGFAISWSYFHEEQEVLEVDLTLIGTVKGQRREAYFTISCDCHGNLLKQVDSLPDRS